jgi:GGDEF domain-containing protein
VATSQPSRARRFALPNLDDERTESSIEAFLDGPKVRRGRPAAPPQTPAGTEPRPNGTATPARRARDEAAKRPAELRTLPGRLEWNAAMTRESTRAKRYERPAAVAIVDLRHRDAKTDVTPLMRSLAGPLSRVLREESRATDLVARVATTRFQILLPETNESGAERQAERLATSCRGYIERTGAPVAIRVSVAATGMDDTLEAALAHALRTIEAA